MKILSRTLHILPSSSVLFFILAGSGLSLGYIPFLPSFYLIPVYFWLIFHPQALPPWSLCGISLFYDSLGGETIGISAVLLLLSWIASHYARPLLIPHHFPIIWGGFCLYSLSYILLYSLLTGGALILLKSWIYSCLLYPLVAWGLSHLHIRLRIHV